MKPSDGVAMALCGTVPAVLATAASKPSVALPTFAKAAGARVTVLADRVRGRRMFVIDDDAIQPFRVYRSMKAGELSGEVGNRMRYHLVAGYAAGLPYILVEVSQGEAQTMQSDEEAAAESRKEKRPGYYPLETEQLGGKRRKLSLSRVFSRYSADTTLGTWQREFQEDAESWYVKVNAADAERMLRKPLLL